MQRKMKKGRVFLELSNAFLFVLDLLTLTAMGLQLQRQANKLLLAVCYWTNNVLQCSLLLYFCVYYHEHKNVAIVIYHFLFKRRRVTLYYQVK